VCLTDRRVLYPIMPSNHGQRFGSLESSTSIARVAACIILLVSGYQHERLMQTSRYELHYVRLVT
jgi:hypothetical protein